MKEAARCFNHPKIMTGVTCKRCSKPICPGCQVETEDGILCTQCYRQDWRSRIDLRQLLRLTAITFGMALICGFLWGVLDVLLRIIVWMTMLTQTWLLIYIVAIFATLLMAVGVGYAISTIIRMKTEIEYGWQIVLFTSLGMLLSYTIAIFWRAIHLSRAIIYALSQTWQRWRWLLLWYINV